MLLIRHKSRKGGQDLRTRWLPCTRPSPAFYPLAFLMATQQKWVEEQEEREILAREAQTPLQFQS